jgi:hypothetical protein
VYKSIERNDDFCEIEAIIRSAADYVQVSRDLRPRVLESARLSNGERRARRRIRRFGLMAAVVAWLITASIDRLPTAENLQRLTMVATGAYAVSSSDAGSHSSDAWTLVDAYGERRTRQAAALQLAF